MGQIVKAIDAWTRTYFHRRRKTIFIDSIFCTDNQTSTEPGVRRAQTFLEIQLAQDTLLPGTRGNLSLDVPSRLPFWLQWCYTLRFGSSFICCGRFPHALKSVQWSIHCSISMGQEYILIPNNHSNCQISLRVKFENWFGKLELRKWLDKTSLCTSHIPIQAC